MKGGIAGITRTHWALSFPGERSRYCLSLFVIHCSVRDLFAHRIG